MRKHPGLLHDNLHSEWVQTEVPDTEVGLAFEPAMLCQKEADIMERHKLRSL